MSFEWPWMLAFGAVLPAMIAAYVWLLRRRRRDAVRISSLSLVREALGSQRQWRRHVPFALLVIAVGSLVVALARPQASLVTPVSRTSIILTIDVSRSMCSIDVEPNRLTVAQQAATTFIRQQAGGAQIGIVAFAGFAELVVPPTRDEDVLVDAIENLSTSFGTVTGSATLRSVDAIADINGEVDPIVAADFDGRVVDGLDFSDEALESETPDAEGGDFVGDIVVLLTDGASVGGVDPLVAAEIAADRRVRVYTIGFGTTEVTPMICSPEQAGVVANEATLFDPASPAVATGQGLLRRFLVLDEPMLRSIAATTGGEYFRAENADQLLGVFGDLPNRVVLQEQPTEIGVFFVMGAAALVLAAIAASVPWRRLDPGGAAEPTGSQ